MLCRPTMCNKTGAAYTLEARPCHIRDQDLWNPRHGTPSIYVSGTARRSVAFSLLIYCTRTALTRRRKPGSRGRQ